MRRLTRLGCFFGRGARLLAAIALRARGLTGRSGGTDLYEPAWALTPDRRHERQEQREKAREATHDVEHTTPRGLQSVSANPSPRPSTELKARQSDMTRTAPGPGARIMADPLELELGTQARGKNLCYMDLRLSRSPLDDGI